MNVSNFAAETRLGEVLHDGLYMAQVFGASEDDRFRLSTPQVVVDALSLPTHSSVHMRVRTANGSIMELDGNARGTYTPKSSYGPNEVRYFCGRYIDLAGCTIDNGVIGGEVNWSAPFTGSWREEPTLQPMDEASRHLLEKWSEIEEDVALTVESAKPGQMSESGAAKLEADIRELITRSMGALPESADRLMTDKLMLERLIQRTSGVELAALLIDLPSGPTALQAEHSWHKKRGQESIEVTNALAVQAVLGSVRYTNWLEADWVTFPAPATLDLIGPSEAMNYDPQSISFAVSRALRSLE